jgi:hypothetical protein
MIGYIIGFGAGDQVFQEYHIFRFDLLFLELYLILKCIESAFGLVGWESVGKLSELSLGSAAGISGMGGSY